MDKVLRAMISMIACVFGVGLFIIGAGAAHADAVYAKRDDDVREVQVVDDDDAADPDTNSNTNGTFNSGTGNSNDGTNSRVTPVSRDRDLSRDDLTKDWTRDGGDRTRDFSRHATNDRSRNDTR